MTSKKWPPTGATGIDDGYNSFLRLAGAILDASGDCAAYETDSFVAWLECEVSGRESVDDRRAREARSDGIARRAQTRIRAARVAGSVIEIPFRPRNASVVGNARQVAGIASETRCAPWVESLEVAAGSGREIWDEPCEQWVELPSELAVSGHVALTVAGDSMMPALRGGDVILVDTRMRATRDCVVVARRDDDGYVVKHVTRMGKSSLELSSFNTAYAPFMVKRSPGAIVGVVVAKLVREGDAS